MGSANKRALISVSNKTGVQELAGDLAGLGFDIISTGGTAMALRAGGLQVTDVSQVTGFPEMLDGRVKTLHPSIHGGILALRSNAGHMQQLEARGIQPIDLVVVNLYPFAETVARPDVCFSEAIEQIDIGGPALIRAAAKNFEDVCVLVEPEDYADVLTELKTAGDVCLARRKHLAARAFAHTAAYDATIQSYLLAQLGESFPLKFTIGLEKIQDLRYGENPHQRAAAYRFLGARSGLAGARQISGKEISYNNYQDADAAWQLVREFERPAAAIIKHANPCGCAEAGTLRDAMQRAWEADPVSRFGGIIACNRSVDRVSAEVFLAPNNKFDVIVAPGYDQEALTRIQQRKGWGLTICIIEAVQSPILNSQSAVSFRQIDGGMLVQDADLHRLRREDLRVVTRRAPTDQEMDDLLFAWSVVKHIKSNAIVVARARALAGMGAGQPNRLTSVELALRQAGEKARGAVLASDAFFPFPDGPETAAQAGVTAIIQPGGSVKDPDVVATMDQRGVAMVFTGIRHFRH